MKPTFQGGINIAIKIPKQKYEATIAFYRDTLALETIEKPIDNPTISRTVQVKFGPNTVWLDCVDNYAHSEIWLELKTSDTAAAVEHLAERGIHTCDEIEKIPEHMHWIMDPAGTVMILDKIKE